MQRSKDGTIKRAYRLKDGQVIESVLMPYEDGRKTACIRCEREDDHMCSSDWSIGPTAFGGNTPSAPPQLVPAGQQSGGLLALEPCARVVVD